MRNGKLLVIEDDYNQGLLYEQELEDEGYSVLIAHSGNEAIEMFKHEMFALVILDIALPDMDGLDLLPRLLEKDKKLPVILNTAYPSYKDHFMSWAADAYVTKSYDLSELKEKVHKLLIGKVKN